MVHLVGDARGGESEGVADLVDGGVADQISEYANRLGDLVAAGAARILVDLDRFAVEVRDERPEDFVEPRRLDRDGFRERRREDQKALEEHAAVREVLAAAVGRPAPADHLVEAVVAPIDALRVVEPEERTAVRIAAADFDDRVVREVLGAFHPARDVIFPKVPLADLEHAVSYLLLDVAETECS